MKKLNRLLLGAVCCCALFVGVVGTASAATRHNFTATLSDASPQKPTYQRPGFRFDGLPAPFMCEKFVFTGTTAVAATSFGVIAGMTSTNCWSNGALPPYKISLKHTPTAQWKVALGPVFENILLHVEGTPDPGYCEFDITGKIVFQTSSETATGANWTVPPALNKDTVVASNVSPRCYTWFQLNSGAKGEFFAERGAQVKYTS